MRAVSNSSKLIREAYFHFLTSWLQVSLHPVLDKTTFHLMNKERLSLMKKVRSFSATSSSLFCYFDLLFISSVYMLDMSEGKFFIFRALCSVGGNTRKCKSRANC